ncbi:TolC family protein [Microbulbifer bruguierae]|uniref:TolC family protein n=1 Tax=Microbulbifer bruguierae TaxID=3029061 RepID=A0ABY8NI02_9GAMM|nr:TolC family protein [Microbulbifer bruguierae]WGL18448.1 TolC family protein [Microbulbifer bruguierae]
MRLAPLAAFSLTVATIAACSVTPEAIDEASVDQRASTDWMTVFGNQQPVTGPIDLNEAIARAIAYNMDNRLKLMEAVVANRNLRLSRWDMLPEIAASAGYHHRNKQHFASSEDVNGNQSLAQSTSLDKTYSTAGLELSWNVLDFGINYLSAKQAADGVMIAIERQRKLMHNVIMDVEYAFWMAAAAQRAHTQLPGLIEQTHRALEKSRQSAERGLRQTEASLSYRRDLLDLMQQLLALEADMFNAKMELASMMGLPPGTEFTVSASQSDILRSPFAEMSVPELEQYSLRNRPELLEEDYRERIAATEIRKACLQLLPGLELRTGYFYDDNSYLLYNDWAESSLRLTWDLLGTVVAGRDLVGYARDSERLGDVRRAALTVAVLTQVNLAYSHMRRAQLNHGYAEELADIDGAMASQSRARWQSSQGTELETIHAATQALLSNVERDASYADWRSANSRLANAVGFQPEFYIDYRQPLEVIEQQVADMRTQGASMELLPVGGYNSDGAEKREAEIREDGLDAAYW